MKKKKGFTLIELLGVIILLGIILTLAIVAYSSSLNKTKVKAFKLEEGNFVDATKSAYVDCLSNNPNNTFCRTHQQLEEKYTYEFIYLKELIDDEYIEEIKNPYDVEQFCDMEKSYVYVSRKNSSQADSSDMVYKACLICGDHKSENCLDDDLDYSSFDTTCTAYYDVNSGELYDGNWTDRNVYLVFGASGNYRYGINEFEYTVNDASTNTITANNSNKATLNLKESVGNKSYKVQAFDGMNGKGTIVSCGANIKIDKGTINSVNISKTKITDNNIEQLVLTANVEPSSVVSGYTYQWYKDGKAITGATSKTYTTASPGTYKVVVTTGVGLTKEDTITIAGYTITYNVNGGTGTIASTPKIEDLSTKITTSKPTKTGYAFMGWSKNSSSTVAEYSSGAKYTENANVTLYAAWKPYACLAGTLTQNTSYSSSTDGWVCVDNNPIASDKCTSTVCNSCTYSTTTYGQHESCGYTACSVETIGGQWCGEYNYRTLSEGMFTSIDKGQEECKGNASCKYVNCVETKKAYSDATTCVNSCSSACLAEGPGQYWCQDVLYSCTLYQVSTCKRFNSTCVSLSNFNNHKAGLDYQSGCTYTENKQDSSCPLASCNYTTTTYGSNCSACGSYCANTVKEYSCPSGWSTYNGTGSSMNCYQSATLSE